MFIIIYNFDNGLKRCVQERIYKLKIYMSHWINCMSTSGIDSMTAKTMLTEFLHINMTAFIDSFNIRTAFH